MSRLGLVYQGAGWAMLGLGTVGVVLPLLPTTPFLLAAVWCFGRSSPRLTAWLLGHPVLGQPLQAWQREGAISTPTKLLALASMAIGYALTTHLSGLGPLPAGGLALFLLAIAIFILSRPSPQLPANPPESPVTSLAGRTRNSIPGRLVPTGQTKAAIEAPRGNWGRHVNGRDGVGSCPQSKRR